MRSDEVLDDLSEFVLPAPDPVETRIPADLVGDAFAIIEFQKNFATAFGDILFSDSLKKLCLADMETILFEKSSSGLFCDMLFFYIQV